MVWLHLDMDFFNSRHNRPHEHQSAEFPIKEPKALESPLCTVTGKSTAQRVRAPTWSVLELAVQWAIHTYYHIIFKEALLSHTMKNSSVTSR